MVVDCMDFAVIEGGRDSVQRSKKLPKLILMATNFDLLPPQISPTRLDVIGVRLTVHLGLMGCI